jgi:hypothetical protein
MGIFQLHDEAILSIQVNEGFCVTGTSSGLVRMWSLDFNSYFLEGPSILFCRHIFAYIALVLCLVFCPHFVK